jgi:uncharacterized membrane protein YraQ (UPF0718 family)
MRTLYLVLAGIGFVVPYYFFVSFLVQNGLDLPLLLDQLFANNVSTFFAVDLIITAVVFIIFVLKEARRSGITNGWVYVLATLLVGPSFSLPLFLSVRKSGIRSLASSGRE